MILYYKDEETLEYVPYTPRDKTITNIITYAVIIILAIVIIAAAYTIGYEHGKNGYEKRSQLIYQDSTTMIRTNTAINSIKYDLIDKDYEK